VGVKLVGFGMRSTFRSPPELISASESPRDQAEIAVLRARHDIHQLTPLAIHQT
jgi:hypothetical protein